MRNIDKIKAMNIDEMAEFLSNQLKYSDNCTYCFIEEFCISSLEKKIATCKDIYKQWLERESEEK